MHTTHDISTAPSTLVITDTKHLSDIIFDMARDQLVLNAASANQQATIEAAKKAFDEATRETSERIKLNLAAVEAYAKANRETLFPMKGQKRTKTFKVLQHALKYRTSESVQAPDDAAEVLLEILKSGIAYLADKPGGQWNGLGIDDIKTVFKGLTRQPALELDKDAFKALAKDTENEGHKALLEVLHLHGLRVITEETFKVEFNFTPSAS